MDGPHLIFDNNYYLESLPILIKEVNWQNNITNNNVDLDKITNLSTPVQFRAILYFMLRMGRDILHIPH